MQQNCMSAMQLWRHIKLKTSLYKIAETELGMHMRQTSIMIMQNVDQTFSFSLCTPFCLSLQKREKNYATNFNTSELREQMQTLTKQRCRFKVNILFISLITDQIHTANGINFYGESIKGKEKLVQFTSKKKNNSIFQNWSVALKKKHKNKVLNFLRLSI